LLINYLDSIIKKELNLLLDFIYKKVYSSQYKIEIDILKINHQLDNYNFHKIPENPLLDNIPKIPKNRLCDNFHKFSSKIPKNHQFDSNLKNLTTKIPKNHQCDNNNKISTIIHIKILNYKIM